LLLTPFCGSKHDLQRSFVERRLPVSCMEHEHHQLLVSNLIEGNFLPV
jgi:hypothetical protein